MEISRLPVWIIPRVEGTPVYVEFLQEDKLKQLSISVGLLSVCFLGGVEVCSAGSASGSCRALSCSIRFGDRSEPHSWDLVLVSTGKDPSDGYTGVLQQLIHTLSDRVLIRELARRYGESRPSSACCFARSAHPWVQSNLTT